MRFFSKPINYLWQKRVAKKSPRYFCDNCFHTFYTGKFWYNDDDIYDEVCPYCGCYPTLTFEELVEEYKKLLKEEK